MASASHIRKIKRHAQRVHFARRAEERLGYPLEGPEIGEIRKTIQSGLATLLARPEDRLGVYRVSVNGRSMIVIYDQDTCELVTLLTEAIWQNQKMFRSPDVKDTQHLHQSLANHPMGEELKKLKGRRGR